MQLGRFQALPIETGRFALDGGAMFGVVPRTLWERKLPPDERNRVDLALRALLLRELGEDGAPTGRNLLVDTGVGQKWDPKLADIYKVDHHELRVETSLAAEGLGVGDITDVVLTHLHFDHAGGATRRDADRNLVPTFPNARYWVQAENLAWASSPTQKDRASYLPENWEPLLAAGVLETIDGPGELLPGLELRISNGHTRAMQLPRVHGPEGSLIYCADLVPTAAHVPVPWVMAYDNEPLVSMQEKQAILEQAVAGDWLLFFEHDPEGPAARVVAGPKGFAAGERSDLRP
ncbi:MAG: MBL fold metallo-hydrolase [Planctomycetota bacterium]